MYRKILWCYVFILTLLEISLNTQLTAQGKSHGVSVHDSLIEGVTLQEWGKDSNGQVTGGAESGAEGGAEGEAEGVRLRPAALVFGRAALAAAHARTVTLTNTANTTLHLASVAGTTPDFHASFFEAKTLPPQGNTTFSVVYLGRREGPVSAHLYIHTSLGVHKYPVSAVGVASEYDVWPLVGVRVPLNASVEPDLTLYNPTDQTIQVSEVYSSGAWLGLRLPGGGERAPRARWAVPPRSARALVTLRLQPPPAALHPLTAYIRIKANVPGGGLVVAVEARSAPAGEHARPLQLRLRARGSHDPPHTVAVELSNSGGQALALEAAVRARCGRPEPEPEPCAAAPLPPPPAINGGSGTAAGARVRLLRDTLEPYADYTPVAQLTLDYGELWAAAAADGAAQEAWCAGCVRVGRAALPYSVRLLPGALRLQPDTLQFVTAAPDPQELRATNLFAEPLRLFALQLPPDAHQHFHVEDLTPLSLRAGEGAAVARLSLRAGAAPSLAASATLRTNLSDYTLPLLVSSGRFHFEWEWPNATSSALELGLVGAGERLAVRGRLANPGPAPLCVSELGARPPPAAAAAALALLHPPRDEAAVCVPGGGWVAVELTVVAGEGAGEAAGEGAVWASSQHARCELTVRARVVPGRVLPRPLLLPPAAPYAWSSAEVVVDNSMVAMSVVGVSLGGDRAARWAGGGALAKGVATLGTVTYAPESECAPRCYTGLDPESAEGAGWARRAADGAAAADDDLALLLERLALFERQAARARNVTLQVRTTGVVRLEVSGAARLRWPRLAEARAGAAGAAAVGGAQALRLLLRNPARAPLLLHALLADRPHLPHLAGGDSMFCERTRCVWARDAWALSEWRVTRGRAARWSRAAREPAHNGSSLPALLLQPDSEVELKITFAPRSPDPLTTYLFLRNNLTILESVQLWGQGAVASFEIGGRRPGSASPILFEVSECGSEGSEGAAGEVGAALVRRSVLVRNTGRVGVRLRDWRVAGRPCAARGFRLQPCAVLHLAPNASRLLHLAYAADFTLARAHAALQLRSELGVAEFTLAATTPAKLLPRCAAGARPPWDAPVRAGAWVLALATFVVVLVAGAVDAERSMRSLRAVRSPPRPPLDLRRVPAAPEEPPPPEPRAPRRRRPARRPPPPLDPHAERRAFERWRSEMMRRDEDDDESRSSEDVDSDDRDRAFEPPPAAEPRRESPPPDTTPLVGAEEESGSSGSDASTPADERDETEAEPYEAENEATTREPSPVRPGDGPFAASTGRREPFSSGADGPSRPTRPRRERAESSRRSERARADSDVAHGRTASTAMAAAAAVARHHPRREKTSKRRPTAPPTPARSSPCASVTTVDNNMTAEAGLESGASGPRGLVRSGASWSSVVGGAAPLPPIGSDVRRREPAERVDRPDRADRSLFYFNGDPTRTDTDFWAAPPAHLPLPAHPAPAPLAALPTHAAPTDRPIFAGPSHDYMAESTLTADSFGGLGVWGGGGAWPWSAPLRPPPGFGAPRSPHRVYDPFRSLASIWAPGAADWRPAPPAPTAPAPGPSPVDDKYPPTDRST